MTEAPLAIRRVPRWRAFTFVAVVFVLTLPMIALVTLRTRTPAAQAAGDLTIVAVSLAAVFGALRAA